MHIHNSKIIQVPTGLHLQARDGVNDGRCTEKVAIILQVSIYPYSIHIPSISMLCTWNEDSLKRSGHRKWMKIGYERRCHYRSIWRCCFFEVFLIVIWTPRGVANVLYLLHLHGSFSDLCILMSTDLNLVCFQSHGAIHSSTTPFILYVEFWHLPTHHRRLSKNKKPSASRIAGHPATARRIVLVAKVAAPTIPLTSTAQETLSEGKRFTQNWIPG